MNNYERKIPEDLDCGLTVFFKVFGAKWKSCIIAAINEGHQRPSEIHRRLKEATPRVIDMQLRELEEFGIVSKNISNGFPLRAEYFLTEKGKSVLPLIATMESWGDANAEDVKNISLNKQSVV